MLNHSEKDTNLSSQSNGVVEDGVPEQEPCIKQTDVDSVHKKVPPSDKERKRDQYERVLKEKTGLSRKGLIVAACVLCLLFVCLIVVISLAACWPTTPHAWKYPICSTSDCLKSSAKIVGMMNASVDPCQDFWRFSCGTWLKEHRTPGAQRSQWNAQEEETFVNRERLRSLIATLPHTTEVKSVNWKLKNFYDSCMSLEYIDTDRDRPIRKLINELGGWFVLREFSVLSWDYKRTMEQLHAQHGVSPFFKVTVVPDRRLPNDTMQPRRNIIQISPSGLGLPDRSYYYRHPENSIITAYKRYIKDVVSDLGATSNDASAFGVDMYHFEKRIAEITPSTEKLSDPIGAYNKMTLSELNVIAPSIPLHQILVAMFPKANIDDSTDIIATSPNYLKKISHLISTTDRSSLNNFLMWKLTESFIPYLYQDFRDIDSYYRSHLLGTTQAIARWEFCIVTMQRFMGFALATLQERQVPDEMKTKTKDEVNNMFETIRSSVEIAVRKSTWFEQQLKYQAMDKIVSLGLQVGFPPAALSDEYLTTHYARLYVQRTDFFISVGNALTYLQEDAMRRLIETTQNRTYLDQMATSRDVFYSPSEHVVFVPLRLAHVLEPSSSLYGSLGVSIAKAVVSSILPPGILFKPRGDLLFPHEKAVNQSARSVQYARRCIMRDVVRGKLAEEDQANRTSLDSVVQTAAIRHAQQALATSNFPHTHQPALETLESDALFYISYAQTLCSVVTSEQQDIDATIDTHLNGLALLQTTLRQLSHFSETFGCSSNSLYVTQPCKDIL